MTPIPGVCWSVGGRTDDRFKGQTRPDTAAQTNWLPEVRQESEPGDGFFASSASHWSARTGRTPCLFFTSAFLGVHPSPQLCAVCHRAHVVLTLPCVARKYSVPMEDFPYLMLWRWTNPSVSYTIAYGKKQRGQVPSQGTHRFVCVCTTIGREATITREAYADDRSMLTGLPVLVSICIRHESQFTAKGSSP